MREIHSIEYGITPDDDESIGDRLRAIVALSLLAWSAVVVVAAAALEISDRLL